MAGLAARVGLSSALWQRRVLPSFTITGRFVVFCCLPVCPWSGPVRWLAAWPCGGAHPSPWRLSIIKSNLFLWIPCWSPANASKPGHGPSGHSETQPWFLPPWCHHGDTMVLTWCTMVLHGALWWHHGGTMRGNDYRWRRVGIHFKYI